MLYHHEDMKPRVLVRKVFRVGGSRVISLPSWFQEAEYVTIRSRDGELVIQPLGVKE
jgi:virulence-associated protein VagC